MRRIGERNCSIDICRLFFAITVVALHSGIFDVLPERVSYYLSGIFLRIAVPFFFVVAGYYYLQKIVSGKSVKIFFKYLRRIFIQYCLWSLVYFIVFLVSSGYKDIGNYLLVCLKNFFFFGSNFHLWFCLGLILAVTVCTALVRLFNGWVLIVFSWILFILACLGCGYYGLGIEIPVLSDLYRYVYFDTIRGIVLTSIPFFALGLVIYKIKLRFSSKINNIWLIVLLVFFIGCLVAELYLIRRFNLFENTAIIVSIYPLVTVLLLFLIKNPMRKFNKLGSYCKAMANFTYFSHPLIMGLIMSLKFFSPWLVFVFVVLICCLIAFVIRKINWRYTNIWIK